MRVPQGSYGDFHEPLQDSPLPKSGVTLVSGKEICSPKFHRQEYNFRGVTFPECEHLNWLCSIELLQRGQALMDQEFAIRAHRVSNLAIGMLIR